jgi:hypothetical protein
LTYKIRNYLLTIVMPEKESKADPWTLYLYAMRSPATKEN